MLGVWRADAWLGVWFSMQFAMRCMRLERSPECGIFKLGKYGKSDTRTPDDGQA